MIYTYTFVGFDGTKKKGSGMMPTDYKKLIDEMRICASDDGKETSDVCQSCRLVNVDYCALKLIEESADAIEELSKMLDKINSLKHDGYYTGTYIKALMETK